MLIQSFSLSYFDKKATFGNIELDATLSQSITLSNIISEHPLENGDILNDAIHNQPITMQLTALISDLPQTFIEQASHISTIGLSTFFGNKSMATSKSLRAWKDLFELWKARQLIQVTSLLQFEAFEDMAIQKISVSVEDSESLTFTADLKQVLISENLTKFNLAPEIGKQSVRA